MWSVFVLADSGREWQVVGDPRSRVAIEAGGMSGMVARSAETLVSVSGRPGSRPVASRVDSLAPSWEMVFMDRDGRGLGEDVAEWLEAWREGVTVMLESSVGMLSTRGRVPPDGDHAFEHNPHSPRLRRGSLKMSWPWMAERPVWESPRSGSGTVEILNYGDVALSPALSWEGSGQSVTVRGVTIPLPSVPGGALMVLDHADNCVVTDGAGVKLEGPSAWSRTRALDLSVVVPPGRSETILATEGVHVSWSVGVKSPWR